MLHRLDCPYCGEAIEVMVDASAGGQDYIEDCTVCCRPIEFHVEIGLNEAEVAITARRDDD
jgi:transcription elongation factor Elf1